MNVSIRTPAPITNANSRNDRSGTIASSAKLAASAMPATVTASRGRRRGDRDRLAQAQPARLLPDPPGDEDVVVRAQRDEQHRGGERDVVREVVVPEQVLEHERRQPEAGGAARAR